MAGDWPTIVNDTGSERCSHCRCLIDASDTPCVWQDQIVCGLCYERLQSGAVQVVPAYATPRLNDVGIPLSPGEYGHAFFDGVSLYQKRVTGTDYVGGSSGITLYDGGLGLSFGESRGHSRLRTGDVWLGTGR
jgi:hypothetical protein